jgi:hypothetical protein
MAALVNANEEEKEEAKVSEIVVEQEETKSIDDEEYPTSPKWDDQDPDDVQQEPPPDAMFCGFCLITPCLMIQWQEDILRSEAHMDPGKTNRVKRFNFYQTMTRELYAISARAFVSPCLPASCKEQGTCTRMARLRGPTLDSSEPVRETALGPLLFRRNL